MIKSDVEFEDKFVALILLIAGNNYKVKFYFVLLMSLYIYLLYI